jgi:Fur family transcriptional regulator, ferric uptake regulator
MITHTSAKTKHWLDCLQASGYRLTGPRYVVVEILARSDRALNAQEVFEHARQSYPTIGLVSVYRTLEKLEELHLIQRVHDPQRCQAYIAGFEGHQHLLICQECGLVEFFVGDDLDLLVSRIEQESGYTVNEHWLQLFGLCEQCRVKPVLKDL